MKIFDNNNNLPRGFTTLCRLLVIAYGAAIALSMTSIGFVAGVAALGLVAQQDRLERRNDVEDEIRNLESLFLSSPDFPPDQP